ncbi:MAG: deoxyhypusine synthase family protein [Chloroflexi bacterium]|nr:deoxyhypusine synthase family protein [Chloroflexota bacterium]
MANSKKSAKYGRETKGTGFSDHLTPLEPLDPAKITTVNDLVAAMGKTAFGARTVGEAADVLTRMALDEDTFVVLTLSGAMTPAKMGLLVCEMIDRGLVQAVVSTGALMSHGLVEGQGLPHFRAPLGWSDADLLRCGYNRIYDVIEPEINLDEIEKTVFGALDTIDPSKPFSSWMLWDAIGAILAERVEGRAILKSACLKGVPVYTPAMSDSEVGGIDVYLHRLLRLKSGKPILVNDSLLDLDHFTRLMARQRKWGIFTIGGGAPRNWAQQVGPCIDLISQRHDLHEDGRQAWWEGAPGKYSYGVRICPDPPHFGHLSGCTYSEGGSWGKIDLEKLHEGSNFAECLCDATIAWPLVLLATLERLKGRQIKKRVFAGRETVEEIQRTIDSGL